jgi:multidrug efflux system membrane fusion protein
MNRFFALTFSFTLAGSALAAELTIAPMLIEDLKAVQATVESADLLEARVRIGGTIGQLKIDEGSAVEAGERLALVGDIKLSLEGKAAEARAASLQAAVEQARLDYERAVELRKTGAGTQVRLDDAKAKLEMSSRNLAAMRAERQVVEQRSAEGAVLAPVAGRIIKVHVRDGSVVLPGESVASIAAGGYLLRLQLPERHARFLKLGDPVRLAERGAANGEKARLGKVVKIYPSIDKGRVIADAEVEGLGDYFVGERTLAHIAVGQRQALILPREYLFNRFGVDYVRLKSGAEIVVQLGLPREEGIEVLSGLKAGDILVTP